MYLVAGNKRAQIYVVGGWRNERRVPSELAHSGTLAASWSATCISFVEHIEHLDLVLNNMSRWIEGSVGQDLS
jgi:hypothetical protein